MEHGFQCINICQVLWEVLKTMASGLGFQHIPRDLANVNVWKTMFDPYNLIEIYVAELGFKLAIPGSVVQTSYRLLKTIRWVAKNVDLIRWHILQ